jgi:hypothetical protein
MRGSKVLVLGAVVGAAVVWLWGREIEAYAQEMMRGVRMKAADGVQTLEATAGKMLDRGGEALRRADDFLQDTKADVTGALRAGEDAIRPAPASARPAGSGGGSAT